MLLPMKNNPLPGLMLQEINDGLKSKRLKMISLIALLLLTTEFHNWSMKYQNSSLNVYDFFQPLSLPFGIAY